MMPLCYRRVISYYKHMTQGHGNCWILYGNPAYPIHPEIVQPLLGAHLTPQQCAFNIQVCAVRVCIELRFGTITRFWAFVDFKKNAYICLQPETKYYAVAVLLTKTVMHIFMRTRFVIIQLHSPTLAEYLQ